MKLWSSERQRKGKDANLGFGNMESKILSFFDLTAIGAGSSLGIGIFVLIGGVIKNVTGPAIVISILLAGIAALIGGLCSAEFGVRFLKTDSAYSYSYFWSKENVAFIYGWGLILVHVAGTASAARGIVTFTDTLSDYKISNLLRNTTSTGFSDVFPYFDFISSGTVVVITVIIAFGVKDSLAVKKVFTVCYLALISFIIISGIFKADAKNWGTEGVLEKKPNGGFSPFGILGIIKGAAIVFYGFIGLDAVCVSGEETQKRKRNLPLAILVITLITVGAYVGVGVVLTLMLFYDNLNPHAAIPFAFQQVGWISFKWIVVIMSFFGFQTSIFGAIIPLSRIMHAMANDGLLFNFLTNGHAKIRTPLMATVTGGLIAAILAGIFPFEKLVNITVIGALFIYTILAINIILLRYSPKLEDDEKLSESWKNLIIDVSMKAMIRNYFNFKEKHPTNLTKKIIVGDLVLFGISSIGISVIFNVFYDSLAKYSTEVVIPASILLSVMFFNIISIICQPISQTFAPFKVPCIPFVPCLSIFLNIFLMITFESTTWILFLSWMGIGIFLHIFWHCIKHMRGEINENSLYEINKTNAIKLNESIWKIKSNKKSFYEGAVNPVFSGDTENEPNQIKNFEIQKQNEETSFQLKQAEIIQTVELVAEERVEPLRHELELNFIRVNNAEIINTAPEEDEKVYWECVAEIHTEEDDLQESEALEIIDNFISEVSEDLLKDDVNFKERSKEATFLEEEFCDEFKIAEMNDVKEIVDKQNNIEPPNLQPHLRQLNKKYNEHMDSNYLEKNREESLKKEFFGKEEFKMNNINYKKTESNDEYSNQFENMQEVVLDENKIKVLNNNSPSKKSVPEFSSFTLGEMNQNKKEFLNLIAETFYEAHQSEMILAQNSTTAAVTSDERATNSILDERGKKKEFKEKLNQLLKNQINSSGSLTKNFLAQSVNVDNEEQIKKNYDSVYSNIKTLNKSQIKDKLEFLLAKGPPRRPSLRGSLIHKIKKINLNSDNESVKPKDAILNVQNNNISNGSGNEENFEKSAAKLTVNVKEKAQFLNEVNKETPDDACC